MDLTVDERDVTFGCPFPKKGIAVNGEVHVPSFVIFALRVSTVYSYYENAITNLKT